MYDGNYLRVRGEYALSQGINMALSELPPRARRILHFGGKPACTMGTTSACAENTLYPKESTWLYRNYLRVRGEYCTVLTSALALRELPPRARRIQPLTWCFMLIYGTTSACAENTVSLNCGSHHCRNYLRVRGEYATSTSRKSARAELPPRARRIQRLSALGTPSSGTTSACAENTLNELGLL